MELEALKCELAAEVLRSAGKLRLRVTGTSMLPAVWPGDELTIRRQPFGAVRPGRLVLVARDGRLCVHRVLAAGNGLVITRGDALPNADPPAAPDQVLGEVVSVLRGSARLIPGARVSPLALVLRHSDLCRSLLLRLRACASAHLRPELCAGPPAALRRLPSTLGAADQGLQVSRDSGRWRARRGDFQLDWDPATRRGPARPAHLLAGPPGRFPAARRQRRAGRQRCAAGRPFRRRQDHHRGPGPHKR